MRKLAIIGSGDLGQQIAYYSKEDQQYEVVGYFDDFRTQGEIIKGLPVLGKIKDVKILYERESFDYILVAVGYKHMAFRAKLYDQFKEDVPFGRLIHSSSKVESSSQIDEGVVIYPGCLVDQHVHICANVLLNIGCSISHDTKIGAHSFLSPRVALAGFIDIGVQCILGINSTVIDNIRIVDHTQIGGGAVVIKDIEVSGLYVGNPTRFIR